MSAQVNVHLKAMQSPATDEIERKRRELAAAEEAAEGRGAGPAAAAAAAAADARPAAACRHADPVYSGEPCTAAGGAGLKSKGHPVWYAPKGGAHKGLKVLNSLTGQLEPFVPQAGNRVLWYTCGPTVYDSCHMGHARAYLTFDILRRIMEDYFHYDVSYHVNITDIDDKIILRARRNKLFSDYKEKEMKSPDFKRASEMVQTAVDKAGASLEKKAAELADDLPAGTPSQKVKERVEKRKEIQLKKKQFDEMRAKVTAAQQAGTDVPSLLDAARDPLSAHLDDLHGADVTDHDIFNAHARRFEREYFEDMEALGVREPDVLTRVTEYVDQIKTYILKIIENGFAYASNGSVYLSIDDFKGAGHDYRKLRPGDETTKAEMEEGEGALAADSGEKRHPNDFALWKASKRGEPAWDSPWGKGRPGWHIECSVVASDVFGDNMDVHAGGSDLKFPHHDNELAQSEAHYGCHQWVNYFFHAGHLQIDGLKMSKSLKNFITIRQALENFSARELRMMFLLQSWHKEMNFSDQAVGDAKAKDKTFREFFHAVKDVMRSGWLTRPVGFHEADRELHEAVLQVQEEVHEALCSNFNTPGAIRSMIDAVNKANKYMVEHKGREAVGTLRKLGVYVTQILTMLGVAPGADDIGYVDAGAGSREEVLGPVLDVVRDFRDGIRKAARERAEPKAFLEACDRVRDEMMPPLGIRLEDPTEGDRSRWKLDDPKVLMREVEDKRRAARDKRVEKVQGAMKKLEADLSAAADAQKTDPATMYRTAEYASWDDSGLPKTKADGSEVQKADLKRFQKEQKRAKAAVDSLNKKRGEKTAEEYVAELKEKIEAKKQELEEALKE